MTKPGIRITILSVDIPVTLPPARKKSRNASPDAHSIQLEINSHGFRVWDRRGVCGAIYPIKPNHYDEYVLTDMPYFDQVYRYLATERATRRKDSIGEFLAPLVDAMDTAIAARDGARVYFAQAGTRIKIGWSRNVATRITQLQTSNPDPIQLLATTPGGRTLERQLHTRFAPHRITGEWFQTHPELTTYITAIGA